MKRLLVVMAVAVFATTAYGASMDLKFQGGGDQITLTGSDTAVIELWLHLDSTDYYGSYLTNLFGTTAATPGDFTFEQLIDGPIQKRTAGAAGGNMQTYLGAGYWYGWAMSPTVAYPHGPADILIESYVIHCTGEISDTTVALGGVEGTDYFTGNDLGGILAVDYSGALAGVLVNQIPEPASLALLALGSLALIRRR